jgi:hypothetical protein
VNKEALQIIRTLAISALTFRAVRVVMIAINRAISQRESLCNDRAS